ncbi:sugar kinase [Bifidobacterium choloepi]|uniref:Sugar kinase n=1 Tax=Bifidobacterium choloepi TaxID=2614131 RepID=A0A6I5MZ60_9BIFI|nr:sugar kinase [Bifidobacterium choloepi]NEG69496.1 sugar kinase [Bifidobacterium choloepi]
MTFTLEHVRPGKVLLAGEPMGLFTADSEGACSEVDTFDASVAGAELNVAIGLKRLGHDPLYLAKLGDDPIGERIVHFMTANGLDTSLVTTCPGTSTGFMMKTRVHQGDPQTYYFRRHSAASTLGADDVRRIDLTGVTTLHLTGILPPLSASCQEATFALLDRAHARDMFVSFDPNLRPTLWPNEKTMRSVLRRIASRCDLILPGIHEGEVLFGTTSLEDTARAFLDNGAGCVIVKDGPRGAYATDGAQHIYVPGCHVDHVVDTVGCGDGFAAGVLSALLEGLDIEEATYRGCMLGAIQTQHVSDNEGLPNRTQLAEFRLAQQGIDMELRA